MSSTEVAERTEAAERRQYLSFALAGSDYAVGILQVKEILQYETVTPVPSVPRSIRGIINLRGAVVPVVDLAVKFGLAAAPVTKRTCIVIVEADLQGERTVLGFVADAVREVLELGPKDVEPPPAFGTQVRVDHLLGMGKPGKGFVLLLDLDRVISADELELGGQLPGGEANGGASAPVPPPGAEGPPAVASGGGEDAAAGSAAPGGQGAPERSAGTSAAARQVEQAIRAHLQWKVRMKTAIACGKLGVPVQTIRADDACPFGRWLYGEGLQSDAVGGERIALVKKLHKRFHQATANVAELALAGRRTEAERALAEGGSFAAASDALLEVLRAWQ
jgi:purine-binding chemotaxis protein CheW